MQIFNNSNSFVLVVLVHTRALQADRYHGFAIRYVKTTPF